jgi:hypothetical protein
LSAHEPEKSVWANKLPEIRLNDKTANKTGNEMFMTRLPELKVTLLFILLIDFINNADKINKNQRPISVF